MSKLTYRDAHRTLGMIIEAWYERTGRGIFQDLEWHGNLVHIVHEDGTSLFYRDAVLVDLSKDYVGVITEHYGYHVFDKDDLLIYDQFSRSYDDWTLADLENLSGEEVLPKN